MSPLDGHDLYRLPAGLPRPPSRARIKARAERIATLQSMAAVRECMARERAALDAEGIHNAWRIYLDRTAERVEDVLMARVGLPAIIRVAVPYDEAGAGI